MSESIENKEIPGVSVKALIWLILSTVSIITTVLTQISSLKSLIVTNKMETDSRIELIQYQIQSLKDEQSLFKIQVKDLSAKLDEERMKNK